MKTTLVTCLVLLLLPAASIAATCNGADFAGTWRIYTVFNYLSRCTLIITSSGAVSNQSSCYLPTITNSTSLTGTITRSTDCHLTGILNAYGQNRQIDAWVSKNKDSISGIGWKPVNVFTGNVFSGVKQ